MTVRLNGSTSGYVELDSPAVGGNNTLFLPNGNGSNGQILGTDGAGNLSWVNGRMVLATAQNSTSGTSIDFTGIPSWVKRVTVMFNGVSTNGASGVITQLGSGSITTTGYTSGVSRIAAGNQTARETTTVGFGVEIATQAASTLRGKMEIILHTGNTYVYSVSGDDFGANQSFCGGGSVTLSGTLDRIRITTANGTDTFDAGSINILYEG